MKVTAYIWKYRAQANYTFANYFLQPVFVDKIKVQEIPIDGIPIYNEQLEKSDGVLEFTAGDFDLKLSLLSPARSVNGSTLKDFLLPDGERNFIYICVIEFGSEDDPDAKRVGGRIELGSIEADLTQTNNRYDIQFKVTGLVRELAELQERARLTPLYQSITIDMFISGCMVPDPQPPYLGFHSRLYWDEKVGFEPKLMWEVYNDVLSRGIGKGKWSVFKELVRGFGFMFKMKVRARENIFALDFPEFILETFWRSAGLEERTVQIKSVVERYSDLNSYKNYLAVTYRSNVAGEAGHYAGMLKDNSGNTWIADNYAGQVFEEMIFDDSNGAIITVVNGASPPIIYEGSATVINLPTYGTKFKMNIENNNGGYIASTQSMMSLFCHNYIAVNNPGTQTYLVAIWGTKDMVDKTIGKEFYYLFGNIKKGIKLEISLENSEIPNVYETISYNLRQYFCQSINNLDLLKNETDCQWTEC